MFALPIAKSLAKTSATLVNTRGRWLATPAADQSEYQEDTAYTPEEHAAYTPVRRKAAASWDFGRMTVFAPSEAPLALQRKLAVGAIEDPLESEADRIAERVMRMPGPEVSRVQQVSTAAGRPQLNRKCDSCEEEEKKKAQRKPVAGAPASAVRGAPGIVHDVLRTPGKPLDAATRRFMEPRFGRDLSRVRVHTDEMATASAQSVDALAYTAGSHMVFRSSQYAPSTESGRKLLAHELAHVMQQTASAEQPSMIARAPDTSTTKIVAPAGPDVCTLEQGRHIQTAASQALVWLENSIADLGSFMAAPGADAVAATTAALNRHFHAADPVTASAVRDRLDTIHRDITTRVNLTVRCHDESDKECGAAAAYVNSQSNTMTFCPNFFDNNDDANWQSKNIVHETAHALLGGPHITDRAYRSDRLYVHLTPQEALTNADSYGLLVWELGTGKAKGSTAPQDSFTDCPEDWKKLIVTAIERAQRWNRNAQTATHDRKATWLAGWTDLQTRYLGATTAAALDMAQKAYDALEGVLRSDITFECEPKGGGRCASGAQTYWYAIWSSFHICPSWQAIGTEPDRITAMLAGLYGFKGGVDDVSMRWKYAMLARDLTTRYWP